MKLEYPQVALRASANVGKELPDGSRYNHSYIQLTIRSPDITEEQWRKVGKAVRDWFGVKHSKKLTDKAQAIYSTANSLGDPSTFTAKEWREVMGICAKKVENFVIENWQGVKLSYQRTHKKLKSQKKI